MSGISDESSITAEWLENILQTYYYFNGRDIKGDKKDEDDDEDLLNRHNIRVLEFQVRPGCEEGENLLSELLAIDVTFTKIKDQSPLEEPQCLHLMAKLLSQDPFCRHFIIEAGFDVREIHFYTTFIPALIHFCADETWPIPRCYYAKYQQGSDSILVLENLKESGYTMVDFHVGLSFEEAAAAAESIAHIHAAALAYRVKENIDLTEAFPFLFRPEAAAESYQQLLERGLPQLASFLHKSEDQQLHAVLAKLHKLRPQARETITDLLQPKSPIATLTHTDFWCNNLLFRHDTETRCSILDWQMVTYSQPTNDVALLLVTSVAGHIRRSHTTDILDTYWEKFLHHTSRLGLDVQEQLHYSKSDFLREYQRSLLLAVLLGIGSVDLAIGQEETETRLCEVLLDLNEDQIF